LEHMYLLGGEIQYSETDFDKTKLDCVTDVGL
jgi:hypothetical protein